MTKVFDCAVRLLSRREHSALELSLKLESKGFNQVQVQETLKTCQELGLQSDQRFAESYCHSRIRRGYGPLKIHQELKHKGLSAELVTHVLKQEEDRWLEHALRVWQKKAKKQETWSLLERQKQQRFLLYRGFDSEIISKVVEELYG